MPCNWTSPTFTDGPSPKSVPSSRMNVWNAMSDAAGSRGPSDVSAQKPLVWNEPITSDSASRRRSPEYTVRDPATRGPLATRAAGRPRPCSRSVEPVAATAVGAAVVSLAIAPTPSAPATRATPRCSNVRLLGMDP